MNFSSLLLEKIAVYLIGRNRDIIKWHSICSISSVSTIIIFWGEVESEEREIEKSESELLRFNLIR